MQKVFISYAHEDAAFARRLLRELNGIGWPSWRDLDELRPGDDWLQKLTASLTDSGILIVILTPAAIQSRWVQTEYKTALANGATVIPVIVKGGALPHALRKLQYVDSQGTRKPWLRILDGVIAAGRRGPQISAKFDVDPDGDPYEAKGNEYLFELSIKNPPRGARRVRYELHDPTFPRSVFYVRKQVTGFALFECQAYGDFGITATIETPHRNVVRRSTLWTALRRQHAGDTRRSITTALSQIRRN